MKLILGLQVKLSAAPGAGCGLVAVKPNAAWVASQQVIKNDAQATSNVRNAQNKPLIFAPNTWVSPYTGERLTAAEETARYPPPTTGRYLIPSGQGAAHAISVDAISTRNAPARFANHTTSTAPGPIRVRASFASRGQTNAGPAGPWLRSTMRIFEGDEIWVNYGQNYHHAAGLMPDERAPRKLC